MKVRARDLGSATSAGEVGKWRDVKGGRGRRRSADVAVELALEDDAARVFDQPKLFHLLADLIFVPAKKTCGLCHRPAVVEFVLEVANIGVGPGFARVCVHRRPTSLGLHMA
jgi:hypothetical protein